MWKQGEQGAQIKALDPLQAVTPIKIQASVRAAREAANRWVGKNNWVT